MPGSTVQIARGVWFHEAETGKGYCNNAVIEMGDYLIVVDANYPGGAKEMIDLTKRLSPKPVKYVFDTHHHGDHSYGNAVWTAQGATTLAYQGVVEEMNRYEPERWLSSSASRPDVGALHLPDAQRPQKTFTGDMFVLKDDSREVRFYFFGWGHTRGDGYVWLPKERVLCTGDAAVNGPFNKIVDADIKNLARGFEPCCRFAAFARFAGPWPCWRSRGIDWTAEVLEGPISPPWEKRYSKARSLSR